MQLNDEYWSERYQQHQTGWDIGSASDPIRAYVDQLSDKEISILIPGCGNAYEALYLRENGFSNITLIDIAEWLVIKLKRETEGKGIQVLHGDFFSHEGQYDLILEQTFFCAILPEQRRAYVEKMAALLKPSGKLAGVLFNYPFVGGPPFGGSVEAYRELFDNNLHIRLLEPCYNSIPARAGREAFIIATRKLLPLNC